MKLHRLKQWYNVADAAKRLTITLDQEVTENDVLQFVVAEQLPVHWYLDHFLFRPLPKTRDDEPQADDRLRSQFVEVKHTGRGLSPLQVKLMDYISGEKKWGLDPEDRHPGIFDVSVFRILDGRIGNVLEYQPMNKKNLDDYQKANLAKSFKMTIDDEWPLPWGVEPNDLGRAFPIMDLPKIADMVFLKESLEGLEKMADDQGGEVKKPVRQSSETRKSESLLIVLAAALEYAELDWNLKKNGRHTVRTLTDQTQILDAPVSNTTIRGYMRDIEKALESRKK